MNETDAQGLASMICAYSLFEFALKRVIWKTGVDPAMRMPRMWTEGTVLLTVLVLGTVAFLNVQLILSYIALAMIYVFYGSAGRRISRDEAKRSFLRRFVMQQILIAVILFAVWRWALPLQLHGWFTGSGKWLLGGSGEISAWLEHHSIAILIVVSSYVFMVDGGAKIVRGMLDKFPNLSKKAITSLQSEDHKTSEARREESVGEWIGILERVIALTFVLTGNVTAIAFALTAKSIARFKELENKDFAEYYLLGTSGSIAIALIIGTIIKVILSL